MSPRSYRDRRESSVSMMRDHHGYRNEEGRTQRGFENEPYSDAERQGRRDMHGRRDADGQDRYRNTSDFEEDGDGGSIHYRKRGQVRNQYLYSENDR